MLFETETIAAISTALSNSGIGIVRISGEDAFKIIQRIFRSAKGKDMREVPSHTIHYGTIVDGDEMTENEADMLLQENGYMAA